MFKTPIDSASSNRAPSRKAWAALLVVALLAVLEVAHHERSATSASQHKVLSQAPVMAVQVVRPLERAMAQNLSVSGAVVAQVTASCGPDISGQRVTAVLSDVGKRVHKGQVLAQLDASSLHIAVSQARASVGQAQATLSTAQDVAKRDAALRVSDAVSAQAFKAARDQVAQDRALLAAAQAQLSQALLQLSHARIVSPIDGVVASRNVSVGQISSAGAQFFTVESIPHLQWQPQLTAKQLAQVHAGQSARIDVAGSTSSGQVVRVAPALNSSTQTALAYVDFDNTRARPGELLSGELLEPSTRQWTIPSSALAHEDGVSFVYLVGPKGHVHRKDVRVGVSEGTLVAVQGLAPADNVVLSGAALLHEGDLVRVVSGATQ